MSLIVTLSHALFKGVQLQWPAIMSHDYTHYGLSATRRTGLNDRSNIPNQTLSKKVSPLDFEHIHWAIHLRLKPIWVLIKMKDRFFLFFILGMYMFEMKNMVPDFDCRTIWHRTIWHRTIWHRTIWHQDNKGDNLAPR